MAATTLLFPSAAAVRRFVGPSTINNISGNSRWHWHYRSASLRKENSGGLHSSSILFIASSSATSTAAASAFSTNAKRSSSDSDNATTSKPRVLILGSGWAGFTLARQLQKSRFDVRVVSPANHFLFTPLLPSTAVGTLEFRAIQEPVRTIQGLGQYYQAKAREIHLDQQCVTCEDLYKGVKFDISYDYLCIAGGMKSNTFNTHNIQRLEGVVVFFLKHLYHARQIRNRILECFERASNPTIPTVQRDRLLSFIVVGGGPTSCEFMSELHDFIKKDVAKWYPDLMKHIKLTLVEAGPGILGSFDKALSEYYLRKLNEKNIDVRLNTAVAGVDERYIEGEQITVARFADGTEVNFGTMVWSAGLAPVRLVTNSNLNLDRGRIIVDDYLRVPDAHGRVFALGDCAATPEKLPPTATVAEQQALYLADCFNNYYSKFDVLDPKNAHVDLPLPGDVTPYLMPWNILRFMNKLLCTSSPKFQYQNRGAMASMGFGGGVVDLKSTDLPSPKTTISGAASYFVWTSTYLTKQLSIQNMILIPMYWFKALVFGRDISRF
jgi:NADH dehydrogenase FAD-containing subunit